MIEASSILALAHLCFVGGDDFLIIFLKCTHAVVKNIMEIAVKKLDVIMTSLKQRMKDMKDSKLQSRRGFYYMPAGSISSSKAI